MADDRRPINMALWGAWTRAGADRWDALRWSTTTFARNTDELMGLLNRAAADVALALTLMNDDLQTDPFWPELDRRLHNQLASTVTLIDHTRRLISYYESDAPDLAAEYEARNARVRGTNEAAFLRGLRNYLLHYSVPVMIQALTFGPGAPRHDIKLSAARLLEWPEWKAVARAYLSAFGDRDGPVLGRDVATYATAMGWLFTWLLEQRAVVSGIVNVPTRFRIDAPVE
jgi:hypothetical protein